MTVLAKSNLSQPRVHFRRLMLLGVLLMPSRFLLAEEPLPFPDSVSFDYMSKDDGCSIRSPHVSGGLTVMTLPGNDPNATRIAISAEFPGKEVDAKSIRISVITKSKTKIEPTTISVKKENKNNTATTTFTCDYPVKKADIDRLLIENTKPTAAKITKVELIAIEKADDPFTRWGQINDLDEDCEFAGNDYKFSLTIPEGSHDLFPGRPFNAPFVLNQIAGDFTFQIKVTGEFEPNKKSLGIANAFNGAGIIVWEGPQNFLRVERNVFWSQRGRGPKDCHLPLIEYWLKGEGKEYSPLQVRAEAFTGRSMGLRVTRIDDKITVSINLDGKKWEDIRTFPTELPDEVFVGLVGINTGDKPFSVDFEEFTLRADRLIAPAVFTPIKAKQQAK